MSFRAFILEDDEAFFNVLTIRLNHWRDDLEIVTARSISEGKQVLNRTQQSFQLAILDQHLPDGLGTELSSHPQLKETAILAVSADDEPQLPANSLKAGAQHFLGKRQISEPLFLPMIEALIEKKQLEGQVIAAQVHEARLDAIKVLLSTLRHEINNPLGAVLGGTYLLRNVGSLDDRQREALRLIEASGNRIKHVLKQLCDAAELEEVRKAQEKVFHIPGDVPWPEKKER